MTVHKLPQEKVAKEVKQAKSDIKPKVDLGSKFTGMHFISMDRNAGQYSESLPQITGDCLKIQRSLVNWRKKNKS